jgi:hypothetical protein
VRVSVRLNTSFGRQEEGALNWESLIDKTIQALITTGLLSLVAIYLKTHFDKKLESFKQDLLEKTHARKALFEKEMEFYEDLSRAFASIDDGCKYFRGGMTKGDPNETRVDEEKRELLPVRKAYNDAYNLIEAKQPFYPADLRDQLQDFLRLVSRHIDKHGTIISDMAKRGWNSPDERSWMDLSRGAEEIIEHIEGTRATIRDRIEQYREGARAKSAT